MARKLKQNVPRRYVAGRVLAGGVAKLIQRGATAKGYGRKIAAAARFGKAVNSSKRVKVGSYKKDFGADNKFGGIYSTCAIKFGKHKLSKTVKMLTPINETVSIDNRSIIIGKSSVGYEEMYNMTFPDLNNLMYIQKRMIASLVSGTTTALQFPEKLLLQSAYSEYRITNNTGHAVELLLFDVKCKRDTGVGGVALYQADVSGLNIDRLSTGLPSGSDAALQYYSYGVGIRESPGFNQFYHIAKTTKMILAPGEHHIHRQVVWYGGKIACWELNQASNVAWKGYSYGLVFQATGSTVVGASNNKALLGEARLDVVASHKIRARAIAMPRKHIEYYLKAGCTLGTGDDVYATEGGAEIIKAGLELVQEMAS